MLIIKRDSKQRLIYYTSKVLHVGKVRNKKIEKLAYAIVLASRRLKPYFQSHFIIIYMNQPIS